VIESAPSHAFHVLPELLSRRDDDDRWDLVHLENVNRMYCGGFGLLHRELPLPEKDIVEVFEEFWTRTGANGGGNALVVRYWDFLKRRESSFLSLET
jgi:hypothetical protein